MEKTTPDNVDLLRAIVGTIPDIVIQTDLDGAIVFANEVALRFGGFVGIEDILGQSIFSFVTPSDREKAAINAQRMRNGPLGPVEYRMMFRPGAEFDFEVNGDVLRDGQRAPCGMVFVIRDVTERKRTARLLLENEARFRSYFELPLIGIAVTTPHKGWLQANDRLCDMLGYSRQELLRMTWAELTHPEDLASDNDRFDLMLAGDLDSYMIEKRFVRKDGRHLYTMLAVGCVRNPDRSVNYVVSLLQDIGARKQMEDALRESEERFRRLAENAQDAIFRMSLVDGKY
ncbi:MAG TPA: PAS domain S-box protein, partial [Candidatus Aminicenantes bacterium]|nr:PAS domain S-box protein [Candidatus Aminicenantes bacterium]